MARIILEPGRTFDEFSLLPGYTKKDCVITNISLESKLAAGLTLRVPMLSAAMTSVTDYDMALALGKEGGLGILPARLPIREQADIVNRIKNYEMSFVEEPPTIRETSSIEEALRIVEKHGHSKIPVIDKNNVFKGMFDQQTYLQSESVGVGDKVTDIMTPREHTPHVNNEGITVQEAKKLLENGKKHYLVVLNGQNQLSKLAFKKDEEKIKVGSAISTHPGWEDRVRANIDAGIDLIVIDTSDAHSEFVEEILAQYKKAGHRAPICAGNIVTYEGALCLMEAGADIVKVGMSSGSICITKREKAVGRAPMTALLEAKRAQQDYFEKTKRYVPIIMDGGIANAASMIVSLGFADALMMGGYFNKFLEAAGEKLDLRGKQTNDENQIRYVATWGEGSFRAQNLNRYGHATRKTFFPEGVEDKVPYAGRLKPNLKMDISRIKAAMGNVGAKTLSEYRDLAVFEVNSMHANEIISNPHDLEGNK